LENYLSNQSNINQWSNQWFRTWWNW
jgi:hypothetical protein